MLALTCSLIVTGATAVVMYQGVNRGDEEIFVAKLALGASFKQYPNAAYTALSIDGRRLNLILGMSPQPTHLDVPYAVSAWFVRVPPGGIVTGEVELRMPIDEWNGYLRPYESMEADLVTVEQILLTIEVIPGSKATRVEDAKNQPGYWSVSGESVDAKCLLNSEVPLTVRKRRGPFPRYSRG